MMIKNWIKPRALGITSSLVCATFLLTPALQAQRLPSMSENPWTGFLSGYKQRDFEFGINNEGAMELYLMSNKKERVGFTRTIKIYPQVVIETDQGKTYYKRLKDDEGFATTVKPGLEHEEVKFTAEATGDVKVEITVKYDRNRIILDGKILDKGKIKDTKVFFRYRVRFPAMYTDSYKDGDKAKSRMRRDKVRFTRAKDGKRITLKTYEEVDVTSEENAKDGIHKLESDMDGQEGKKLIFETLDEKGKLVFKNRMKEDKGKLWEGFEVIWLRPLGDTSVKPFVIEVK